jgi:hypothetical protein
VVGGTKGEVTAQDVWTVQILHPQIEVIKTGPPYAHEGDVITYTFLVRNIGDCTLYEVTVIDDVMGDIGSIAVLPLDDPLTIVKENEVTLTKQYTVPIASGEITNVVTARGNDGHGGTATDTDTWTVQVTLLSVVTDTEFCIFDVDPERDGQQFRLIFTPDFSKGAIYKLSASNPGQFYYNVFFVGTPGDEVTIDIRIPYPFVTNGAVPVHVYEDFDTAYCPDCDRECFVQIGELTGFDIWGTNTVTPSGAYGIALSDYSPQNFGSFAVLSVKGTVPETGLIYVTIHLEYGLKQTAGYAKNSLTLAATGVGLDGILGTSDDILTIPNFQAYEFAWNSGSGWTEPTIESENAFKKDPGFAGLVTDVNGDPVAGAVIHIFRSDAVGSVWVVITDQDGWYMYSYKYTGKPTKFTIKETTYRGFAGAQVEVWVKSNSMNIVNFNIPYAVS